MAGDCPRCGSRSSWDVIGELFLAMEEGVRRAGSKAEIIHYDWGWPDEMTPRLLEKLPASTSVASISEWSVPVERGGVRSAVGEYSISVVGPGPRAKASWAAARKRGMRTIAKVQFNNTWEISAVPYIPVPGLIADHCRRLREEGVDGIMAAWTCGGYPSPNLRVAHAFAGESMPDEDRVLQDAALVRFGRRGASEALTAWRLFSEAFLEFPYGVAVYIIPTQHGPANLLRLEPTGLRAGMILFPHDAWKAWCGKYPPLVVEEQFARLAALWNRGLAPLARAVAAAPAGKRTEARMDLAIARTCHHHFQSVANQLAFYRFREMGAAGRDGMRKMAEAEISLAIAQFPVARDWSVIGYEASNHYYYTPLDLVEKVLNCRAILDELGRA